jgi:hypothetical protein
MPSPRVDALIARLEKGRAKTLQAFRSLQPEQWSWILYPGPPQWDVKDLLAHLASAEVSLLELAQNVAAGGNGVPPGFDYDAFNAEEQRRLDREPPEELLSRLDRARSATLQWIATLDDRQLDRVGRHPGLGEVTVEVMITAMYGHPLLHMRDLLSRMSHQGPA